MIEGCPPSPAIASPALKKSPFPRPSAAPASPSQIPAACKHFKAMPERFRDELLRGAQTSDRDARERVQVLGRFTPPKRAAHRILT
jgi:hypothetical protein